MEAFGCFMCFVFFSSRRRHTRFDCDWSSDVCSSDLNVIEAAGDPAAESWRNIHAIDDLVEAILTTTNQLTVAAVAGKNGKRAGRGREGRLVGGGSFKKK